MKITLVINLIGVALNSFMSGAIFMKFDDWGFVIPLSMSVLQLSLTILLLYIDDDVPLDHAEYIEYIKKYAKECDGSKDKF